MLKSDGLLINGRLVDTPAHDPVIDPASGAAFAYAAVATQEHLEEAVQAARRAAKSWAADEAGRRAVLRRAAAVVEAHQAELAELICREQGKPLAIAKGEVMGSAKWFSYTADLPLEVEALHTGAERTVTLERRPVGLTAAITPWNYPLISAVWKLAPAFLAGNCVILKPSPFTPLATLRLGALLSDIVPVGVLAVLSGGDELGRQLVAHAAVRKVSLTGSVAAGISVFEASAPRIRRLTLELGGNDPAIVCKDAWHDGLVEDLFWGAFRNSGQICSAIKRLYVHETLYDRVVAGLRARIARTVMGPGLDPASELGPVSTLPQYQRVQGLIEQAAAMGRTIVSDSAQPVPAKGYFIAPHLVTDAQSTDSIVSEEQFGPVLPVLPFSDIESVLEQANGTEFGLSASVWSADVAAAQAIARQIDCGTAWINSHLVVAPWSPVGGRKMSGLGLENGVWGLHAYTDTQVVSSKPMGGA